MRLWIYIAVVSLELYQASSFFLFEVARVDKCEDCAEAGYCYDLGFLGSFCSCKYGFQGNGTTCDDEDECSMESHSCPGGNSICINQPGSYSCLACPFGANNDSTSCLTAAEAGLGDVLGDGGSGEGDDSIEPSASVNDTSGNETSGVTPTADLPAMSSGDGGMTSAADIMPTASEDITPTSTVDQDDMDAETNTTDLSDVEIDILPRLHKTTEGGNATICCIVESSVENLTLSWYQNGNLLNSTNETLVLENVTNSDAGFYQCEVSLDEESVLSSIAEVEVQEEGQENGCDVTTRTAFVPQECPSRIGDNSVEVRFCPRRQCDPMNEESDSQQCQSDEGATPMCCGATEYEKMQVPCYGFILSMITPSACECRPCDDPATAGQITINGRVVDKTGRIPLRFGKVWLGGEEVAETDIIGAFTISLAPGTERLVLTFTDPRFSTFHQSTKVLHLNTQKSVIFYTFHAPLLQKETTTLEETTIIIRHKDQEIAKIELPEGTDVEDKIVYGNVVSQSIYASSFKDNIGDSFTIDDFSLEQPISIVLLLCLTVQDDTQTAIDLPGTYSFSFSKSYVQDFMESHEIDDVWLFELDAISGYWNTVTHVDMNGGENGVNNDEEFASVDADMSGEGRWFALGGLAEPCLLKVGTPRDSAKAYADIRVFRTPLQFTSTWSSVTAALTTGKSVNCLLTPCGFHSVVITSEDGKESNLVLDIQRPGFLENDDSEVNTTEVEGRYLALKSCVQEGSFDIITSSRDDDVVENSALTYLEETSLDLLQQLPPEDLFMAWYPMAYANMYKACFIKIRSTCADTETVTVMSYPGTFKDTQGQLYGIRSSVPSMGSACVEYKCSGPLYTQIDTDITVLDINIKDTQRGRCFASDISNYLLRRILLETPGLDQPLKGMRMYAPVGTTGSQYGLYSATSQISAEEARDKAWKQCVNGADPNQPDQTSASGSESRGIAVTFGSTRLNLMETVDAVENMNLE